MKIFNSISTYYDDKNVASGDGCQKQCIYSISSYSIPLIRDLGLYFKIVSLTSSLKSYFLFTKIKIFDYILV